MKIAIKTFLVIVAIATITHIAIAQTPYDDFAPSNKKKEMLTLPNAIYRAYNYDTSSTIKLVTFDKDNLTLTYYSKSDSVINVFKLTPKEFKWWSVDPMAHKYSHLTPYDFVGGNPINRTDPNGADWFKDENGNTQWFDNSSGGFSDLNKTSWTNIGTEMLEFNGKQFTYSWQTTNKDGSLVVNSMSFDAVSGVGMDKGYWNMTRVFDYSKTRQGIENQGPTPEGLYSINRNPFIENINESGTANYNDLSYYDQAKSLVGGSNWPGGTWSWGEHRWKLQFENVNTSRDDFYLHGGGAWGSRGCIDLGAGINNFYTSFMSTNPQNTGKVYLRVKYADELKYEIQNRPTNMPLVTPFGVPLNR